MHLKSLTVLGFKSFAEKTALQFQPGITAIVGPNGCGKSNVADAIRWVLGEQSAKALRGDEMADVIFNGTDSRRALSMAEVSLTIDGIDQDHLKAAGVELAYHEVTLTRRVFRDGGSEYFINQTPCRLKDLQQLFMGTGVGRSSYSIMAQGNITQILSSKPEERRMVFEEAAGISKYKAQKKEALRKLEYTEQNLLRVGDLIREVKRQIGSLQRQAGKARRYKQLMLELQHMETQLARHHYDQLRAEITERQQRAEELAKEMAACAAEVSQGENEISQLRERALDLEQEISQSQQQELALNNQIDRHQSRIQFNEERLRELESQNGKVLSDIAQAEERRMAAEEECRVISERLADCAAGLAQHRQDLKAREQASHNIAEELRLRQEALRQAQAALFASAQQLTRTRNELSALDLQKQGNIIRLEKLSSEKIQLEEERARLERSLEEFARQVQAERKIAQDQRQTLGARQKRLGQNQQEQEQTAAELDRLLQQEAEKRSRLSVLEQLEADYEGFSAGAQAILRQARPVLGSLADRLRVPDSYVTAIEAALGHHLQVVLTDAPEAARDILADLTANKKGRASIASLCLLRDSAAIEDLPARLGSGESAVNALSVVDADESIRGLLKRLVGGTYIVPDLASATRAWRQNREQFDFVTLAGEMLTRHGIFRGGSSSGNEQAPSSILGRKNQIADLQRQIGQLEETLRQLSQRRGSLQGEQTQLTLGLEQDQTALRAQEVAIATHEGEFNALQNSRRVLHQKIDTVVYEISTLSEQEQEGQQKRSELLRQAGQWEQRERAGQEQLAALGAALEELRQQREAAAALLTEIKVALAAEEQLHASFLKQQQPLQQRINELGQLIEHRRAEIGAFITRQAQAKSETDESQRQIETLQGRENQIRDQISELQRQKEIVEDHLSSGEQGLRDRRAALADRQQRRGSLEVELAQKEMAVQNLCERIQQKYQVKLQEIRSECITITIAEGGPPKIQTLTPEEMAASGAATDWGAVAEQVAAYQKRLDEMGPVNLVAIEEYEETEQRCNFLSEQHADLVKAKEQLLEVIHRINAQTKEMFAETFAKIQRNFRDLFGEVFGGGKAELRLADEADVLESGIEIVARPPGKQLQSISLLSGGEQTMTAVALLFAIYQVKPSPFCVLDELDAPLDESNINRFIRILQRFLAHSQFVIITHNKRTIGMADVLYGVTMQERGVSKIVSVKFHKADEAVTDHAPVSLETPVPGKPVEVEEDQLQSREETLEVVG